MVKAYWTRLSTMPLSQPEPIPDIWCCCSCRRWIQTSLCPITVSHNLPRRKRALRTLLNFSKPPSVSLIVVIHCCAFENRCFRASLNGPSHGSSWITPMPVSIRSWHWGDISELWLTSAIIGDAVCWLFLHDWSGCQVCYLCHFCEYLMGWQMFGENIWNMKSEIRFFGGSREANCQVDRSLVCRSYYGVWCDGLGRVDLELLAARQIR